MADRRRLTVNQCAPVTEDSKSGPTVPSTLIADLIAKLKAEFPGKKVACITSKTDNDMARRKSFKDKDEAAIPESVALAAEKGVLYVCKKGQKPESPNQDSFALIIVEGVFGLYGVFDGHGPNGHDVSHKAIEVLLTFFINHEKRHSDSEAAFKEAFEGTQKAIDKDMGDRATVSGSTCTMMYYREVERTVTIAYVGDSRAILAGKKKGGKKFEYIKDLTIDHKPELPEEKKRIEAKGGRVVFDGYFNYRVFEMTKMTPGLNMSRALGDCGAHKSAGLTAEPDTQTMNVGEHKDNYEELRFIIASDGVWEFIEGPEACQLAGNLDTEGAKALCKLSYDKWMEDSEGEISDDITCLTIDIPTILA